MAVRGSPFARADSLRSRTASSLRSTARVVNPCSASQIAFRPRPHATSSARPSRGSIVACSTSHDADGHQAWRILQKETIDLVVADVEMPGMDGFTLTDTLRHSATLGQIPVVLVTSLSSDKDRARGMEVGASAYIVKSGFGRGGLVDAVGQLL